MPAFFFTPIYDEYHEYGERTIAAFLNIRNPKLNPTIKDAGVTNTAGEDAMNALIEEGFDGFIREYDGVIEEINAFRSNQIKSADRIGQRYRSEDIEKEVIAYSLQYALEGGAMNELKAVLSDNSKALLDNLLNYIGYDSGKDYKKEVERQEKREGSNLVKRQQRTRNQVRRFSGLRGSLL